MPPFTTLNGQTGYFDNSGQFVPASQEQYNQQFGMLQQFGGNPFLNAAQQSPLNNQRTNFVQQGSIQSPETAAMSNEQKLAQGQGNSVNQLDNTTVNQNSIVNQNPAVNPAANAAANPMINFGTNVANTLQGFLNTQNPYNQNNVVTQAPTGTTGATGGGFFSGIFDKVGNKVKDVATAAATTGSSDGEIPTVTLTKRQLNNPDGENWFSKMFSKKTGETTTTTPPDGGGKGGAFKGTATTAAIGGGIGAASKLIGSLAPGNYDERVGMTDPNLIGTVLGDATFTQMGSSFGPAGMAIGGGIDLVKNIVKYAKQKDVYSNKKLATNTMQSIDDARENMKPDYTGYARFGTQVNNPYLNKNFNIGTQVNKSNINKYKVGGNTDPEEPKKSYESAAPGSIVLDSGGIESNNPVKEKENATNTMQSIYNSKGYQDKLNRELSKSNKMSYRNRFVFNNPFSPYPFEDGFEVYEKNNDRRYENKSLLDRRKEGLNVDISYMDANDENINDSYGYYATDLWEPAKQERENEGLIQYISKDPYIKINPKNDHEYYTLIEELEHASHYPGKNTSYYSRSSYPSNNNITPYAQKILKKNIGVKYEDNDYLTELSEAIAKKRATEAYLIENGMLKPGENIDKSHFEFLKDTEAILPSNVKSMLDLTNSKIENYFKKDYRFTNSSKILKKKNKDHYKRFENIMNKIAMQQNPYINEPIS
jgi:hypothetical protein